MQFSNFIREKVARRYNLRENDTRNPYNLHRNLAAVGGIFVIWPTKSLVIEVAMVCI